MEIIFFLTFTLIVSFSTLGYGYIVSKYLKLSFNNVGLNGILGLFILSILSSYTHLFFPHNYLHNLVIIFFGLGILFKFKNIKINDLKLLFFVVSLLIIFLFISKTNEDFGYYHLPNSLQFSHFKIQFGLGNLNHGFKHISSLFLLMSLNYLPYFEYYLFNLTNFLFYAFFVLFLYKEIFYEKNIKLNFSKIILSLFLILFLTKFSRLAEFGSDLAGQIIVCIYLFFVFEAFFNSKLNHNKKIEYISISIILITFAITLKFILIIYSLLVFVVLILIDQKKKIIIGIFQKNLIFLSIASLSIFLFFNFSATGCLIYPVEKLCFSEKFEWSLDSEVVKYLNLHYELWSKAGRGPNFIVENPSEYIKGFNWFGHWLSEYFYGKFTDYILVILTIIFIYFIFFSKSLSKNNKFEISKKKFLLFYLTIIIIFLIWLFNFPTLRYAGYIITYLVFILPFVFVINKKIDLFTKKNLNKIFILIIISYSIFLLKNITRINSEINLAKNLDHNFSNFPFYWVKDQNYQKIIIDNHNLNKVEGACWNTKPTCVRGIHNLRVRLKNNYIFYVIENEKK